MSTLKQINLNNQTNQLKPEKKTDVAISELGTYTSLMDQYSLHNFMIWNGRALKSTPEFQSFQRTYSNEWSYILSVITQLEKLMTENSIKLAIIAGVKVAEYASLNLPSLQNYQILDCVANVDQIRSEITSFEGDGNQHIIAATVKIQALARQWYAMYKYREMKRRLGATILLQSIIRRFVMRCQANNLLKSLQQDVDSAWEANKNNLADLLRTSVTSKAKKLIIYIPSVTAAEFYRMQLSKLNALQNSNLSCLHQLVDPNVSLVYITPRALSPTDLSYVEKFLNLMNISILPNRLKFVVPELSTQLPDTTPVAQGLWYSSSTLNKLRSIMAHHKISYIIPSSAGWPEKRISHYLK
jgi:IQ domain-containing protein H